MSVKREILLVEDDEDLCDAVSDALEDAGYAVAVAMNGALALRFLQASDTLPTLILLDLMMPVMDGETFLDEMRRDPRLAALPVVVLTADGHAPTKAARLGVPVGLRKPIRLTDLLSTLSQVIHTLPHEGEERLRF